MKWVPTNPAVEKPQIAKLPAISQKSIDRAPSASPSSVSTNGLPARRGATDSITPPSGASPIARGESGSRPNTTGRRHATTTATVTDTARQPWSSAIRPSSGRNTSCPAAFAAISMPMARLRCAVNHRLATAAAMPIAPPLTPTPIITPQVR
jgi:hypothetical protein